MTFRNPDRAASDVVASQRSDGNSAHCPMFSPSSGDQVTRFVQRSLFIVHSPVCRWQAELAGLDKTLPCLWRFGYSRAGRPAKAFSRWHDLCRVAVAGQKPFRISFSSLRSEHWPAHGAFDREFYEAVPYRTNGITNGSRQYRFAEAMSVHITAGYLNGERWF